MYLYIQIYLINVTVSIYIYINYFIQYIPFLQIPVLFLQEYSNSCGIQSHSGGFQWIPVPFWWIPAESSHSCRNVRGIKKYWSSTDVILANTDPSLGILHNRPLSCIITQVTWHRSILITVLPLISHLYPTCTTPFRILFALSVTRHRNPSHCHHKTSHKGFVCVCVLCVLCPSVRPPIAHHLWSPSWGGFI